MCKKVHRLGEHRGGNLDRPCELDVYRLLNYVIVEATDKVNDEYSLNLGEDDGKECAVRDSLSADGFGLRK